LSGSGLAVVVALLAATAGLVALLRPRRASTLDFYLAGQQIGVVTNACAICGDYFSAASFLGVAAAVYAFGLDGIWFATGFAAGFVPVLLFVAAPLRRFGQFSLPDFLGRRFDSEAVRLVAVGVVQLVVLSYLVPQAVASGVTWELLVVRGLGGLSPYASGVLFATVSVTGLVVVGGMRGATWTQAVQFLFKLAALVWLAAAVLGGGFSYAGAVADLNARPLANPELVDGTWQLEVGDNRLSDEAPTFAEPGARYGAPGQFALVVTLVLGTSGLPHITNRYFTSPSGKAARTTTVWVIGLAGVFYGLAVLLGVAARDLIPEAVPGRPWLAALTVDGVLRVPEHALLALGRLTGGEVGLGVVASGALLALLSTIAGLLLAAAASLGHDVYERHVNPKATPRQAVRAGRLATAAIALAATVPALAVRPEALSALFPSFTATMVTWAFALAGSALTPVVVLAIWWPRATAAGAVAGMVTGVLTAVTALAAGLAAGPGTGEVLLAPTFLAAPAAVLANVGVSRCTRVPQGLDALWLRLHGTAADRRAERLAELTIRGVTAGTRPRTREAAG
jgi:cation/acetate symporter